jgi:hypothetical protein
VWGNGDLSVSVYQTADRIVWRFGKGNQWDRRLDLSDDPKPAHISEIVHGIKVEGWKWPPSGTAVEWRGYSFSLRKRDLSFSMHDPCGGTTATEGVTKWTVLTILRCCTKLLSVIRL